MNKMKKIYQRFDLDLNSIEAWEKRITKKYDIPKIVDTFRHFLLGKGYEVLESNDVHFGLCGSLIIGGEIGKNIKLDFCEGAAFFEFPYKSGPCYLSNTSGKPQLEVLASSDKSNRH